MTKRTPPAVRDMKKLQNTTHNLIPRSCMARVVKEALQYRHYNTRITQDAMDMLHGVSEDYVIKMFKAANVFAQIARRETVTADDMRAVSKLQGILK